MDTNSKTHFPYDAVIVLGAPCTPNGRPAPEQRERVLEGVRQFHAGAAPILIMCGGAVHNGFKEAESMAQFARELGVPSHAIIQEDKSRMTVENIIFSAKILRRLRYENALIISSPMHMKRISRIINYLNSARPDLRFNYSTKSCLWPKEFSKFWKIVLHINEWNLNRKPLPKHRFIQDSVPNTLL